MLYARYAAGAYRLISDSANIRCGPGSTSEVERTLGWG